MSNTPIHKRYSRAQVVQALAKGQSWKEAANILCCDKASLPKLVDHYGIRHYEWHQDIKVPEDWMDDRSSGEHDDLKTRKPDWATADLVGEVFVDQEEARPDMLFQGAFMVAQDVVAQWSRRMGMKQVGGAVSNEDVALVREEFKELELARDEVEDLDALADIVYTCLNIAYRRNLPLHQALAEVHRSNETKTPNGDGKPTKGNRYMRPDLESILKKWRADGDKVGA